MGLFEILLVAVVTLLVVGPERMPEAVRSVALTVGRMKRMFNSARDEIEKHVGADEIRQQLHNEAVMDSLAKMKEGLSDTQLNADDDEPDMPWTDEEYEKIQRAHAQQEQYLDEENNTIHNDIESISTTPPVNKTDGNA